MAKSVNIETGMFLRSHLGIRRVGDEAGLGFHYVAYFPNERKAERGFCSDTALRQWGKPISADEAEQFIPNMAEQLANLEREERAGLNAASAVLEPMFLGNASDEALIAELRRRGYEVKGRETR